MLHHQLCQGFLELRGFTSQLFHLLSLGLPCRTTGQAFLARRQKRLGSAVVYVGVGTFTTTPFGDALLTAESSDDIAYLLLG